MPAAPMAVLLALVVLDAHHEVSDLDKEYRLYKENGEADEIRERRLGVETAPWSRPGGDSLLNNRSDGFCSTLGDEYASALARVGC